MMWGLTLLDLSDPDFGVLTTLIFGLFRLDQVLV